MNCEDHKHGYLDGHYVLPPLPYDPRALEPWIDEETLTIHHDRHHATYVSGANEAMTKLHELSKGEVNCSCAADLTRDLSFNLAGHILHSVYWQSMAPQAQTEPSGELAAAIARDFDSLEGFYRIFRCLALTIKGCGWVVLGLESISRRLVLYAVQNHQDAMTPAYKPLLVCDVWEHAYYLKYENKRANYIDAFLKVIDWKHAERKFERNCHE